jgi:transcriptional regulator with XRE-family HTH domain
MPLKKKKPKTPFSIRLIKLRESKGLTQKEAAAALKLNAETTYQNWELGKNPTWRNIDRIIDFYGCSRSWLLTGDGEPYPGVTFDLSEIAVLVPAPSYRIESFPGGEVQSPPPSYGPGPPADPAALAQGNVVINVDEAIGKTFRILSSRTPYAVALYLNIQQFSASLDSSQELAQCKDMLLAQQAQIDELREKVDRLTAVPDTAEVPDDGLEKEAM